MVVVVFSFWEWEYINAFLLFEQRNYTEVQNQANEMSVYLDTVFYHTFYLIMLSDKVFNFF